MVFDEAQDFFNYDLVLPFFELLHGGHKMGFG